MFQAALIPQNTVITEKGDGVSVDLSSANARAFLILLDITKTVEQESFDLAVFGSADAQTWSAKPLLEFPQKFYRGQTPMLLDLSSEPDVKFVRAHWEVNRWGRGSTSPTFEVGVTIREVPATVLAETARK